MPRYIVGRLIQMVPLLLGTTLVVFFLVNAVPGSPVQDYGLNDPTVRPEDLARIRTALGLDEPVHLRYLTWLSNVVRLDFGLDLRTHRPVALEVWERVPATLELTLSALLLTIMVAVPIGVLSAIKRNGPFDQLATFFSVLGTSLPSFWFALMLIFVFGVELRWLPTGGTRTIGASDVFDHLRYLLMPTVALAITLLPSWVRYTRTQMLEVLNQDYLRTARAKGLREDTVVRRHALRNALIPLMTLAGLAIPALFSGALVTETIFSWPGVGRLTYDAALARNYPVVMATALMTATLAAVGSLVADIGYRYLDPRIRLG